MLVEFLKCKPKSECFICPLVEALQFFNVKIQLLAQQITVRLQIISVFLGEIDFNKSCKSVAQSFKKSLCQWFPSGYLPLSGF